MNWPKKERKDKKENEGKIRKKSTKKLGKNARKKNYLK